MRHSVLESRLSPAAIDKARLKLDRLLGPSRVTVAPEELARCAADESGVEAVQPDLVVRAECSEHLSATLAVAAELSIPVTARGAGTGKSGGAIPVCGGIVVTTAGMNQVKEIDRRDGIAVVEPGVVLAELHRAVEREGWFYPPDPASLKECFLGGNVAENAGGPRACKYGVTRDYVLGLEVYLMGGQRLQVGRRTRKGVTGYDLTALLVGSEGTLGVFGDITLRLVPKPETVWSLVAPFRELESAALAVSAIAASGVTPRAVELLDGTTLSAMRATNPMIPEVAAAMLFLEVDGAEAACREQAERVADACSKSGALEVQAANQPEQRERLWQARRDMSPTIRGLTNFKVSEDVAVPLRQIPALLQRTRENAEQHQMRWLAYGHAGDGNLHVNFLWDDPADRPRVDACVEQLFRDTVALGGTLSGEHGIGLLKAPYLGLEQSLELIELERRTKQLFDPSGLLNPGKIFPD